MPFATGSLNVHNLRGYDEERSRNKAKDPLGEILFQFEDDELHDITFVYLLGAARFPRVWYCEQGLEKGLRRGESKLSYILL